MAKQVSQRSLTKTAEGVDRATDEDFDNGAPVRPLHLKRGDPRAAAIEGKPKFKTPQRAGSK